jgi:hypothetical protein
MGAMGGIVVIPTAGSSRLIAAASAGFGAGTGAMGADLVLGATGAGFAATGADLGVATADGPFGVSMGLAAVIGLTSMGTGLVAGTGLASIGAGVASTGAAFETLIGLISTGAAFGTLTGLISIGAAFTAEAGLAGGSFFEGAIGVGLLVFSAMRHSQGCNHYTYVAAHNIRFAAGLQAQLCSAA